MQKFVPRSRVGIFRNERSPSTPLDPKLTFWYLSYYLGAFGGPFGWLTKLGAKWAERVQKFVPRSRFEIFRNERGRSPHWTYNDVLVHFVLFGCIRDRLVAIRN